MTTTEAPSRPASTAPASAQTRALSRVVRSEWLKFRTVRSSWLTLLVTIVLVIGLGALFSALRASHWPPRDPGEAIGFDATQTSLAGVFLAQLAVGVLGVLVVTAEYTTGTIRATFTAVPHRLRVMSAKTLVFGVLTLVALIPTVFAAFAVGQHFLTSKGIEAHLGGPGVTRAVFGAALYLTLVGLFGCALGWIIRHTAGAISTLFGLLLVVPILTHLLPSPWNDNINKWLPSSAGQSVFAVRPDPTSLGPWAGFSVLALYVAVSLGLAAILVQRRDT